MVYVLCMCVMCTLVWGDVECMVYVLGMMCDVCVYVWCMEWVGCVHCVCIWCVYEVYGMCMYGG